MRDGIFISYRREDSAGHTGRIYDAFRAQFGKSRVFLDIVSLAPAVDFETSIDNVLQSSRIVIVVLGPRWLDLRDDAGHRRLDKPEDFVRNEIERALDHGLEIVLVLVGGARLPSPKEVPKSIAPFLSRNAAELSDLRWAFDTQRLLTWTAQVLGDSRGSNARTWSNARSVAFIWKSVTALSIALVMFLVGAAWLWQRGPSGLLPTSELVSDRDARPHAPGEASDAADTGSQSISRSGSARSLNDASKRQTLPLPENTLPGSPIRRVSDTRRSAIKKISVKTMLVIIGRLLQIARDTPRHRLMGPPRTPKKACRLGV